jgi:hypothetical protein
MLTGKPVSKNSTVAGQSCSFVQGCLENKSFYISSLVIIPEFKLVGIPVALP